MEIRWQSLRLLAVGDVDGHIFIRISEDPISVDEAFRFVSHPECGGNAIFAGTTRSRTGPETTELLVYEADKAMAHKEVERIVSLAFQSFEIRHVFIAHRVGVVAVAETSIVIAVSSVHREASFLATRYLIDTLKEFLPIWKKNLDSSGSSEWVEQTGPNA